MKTEQIGSLRFDDPRVIPGAGWVGSRLPACESYIRPTEEGVRYYEETWGYGRVVRHDEAKKEIAEFRRRVRQMLTSGAVGSRIHPFQHRSVIRNSHPFQRITFVHR